MKRPDPASIPLSPGVYIYKDVRGCVIYVGKARILRRRVLSYFRPSGLPPKTVAMIGRAATVEYIPTTTEKEALLLEANLIKKYRPRYNIVLRDDKHYFLFRLNLKHPFPRLEIIRRPRRDGALYFGPFTSSLAARETWKLIHKAIPLRRCSDRAMKNRVRPCLYHHMGQCPAPCLDMISQEEYAKRARKVRDILSGNSDMLLKEMQMEMDQAASGLDFERAAVLRDQIKAVEKTVERQAAILPGAGDMDAIGLWQGENGTALGIVFLRKGAVTDSRAFYWSGFSIEDSGEMMGSFLNQFYGQVQPPARILLPWLPRGEAEEGPAEEGAEPDLWTDKEILEQVFSERRGGAVRIVAPQNVRDNQLVDLAIASAKEEARCRSNSDPVVLLERLRRILNLDKPLQRIECVDVSHISGTQTRVGMVVYENGLPCKEDYRVYSMPDSNDDYGTLYSWAARRLESGAPWPDLLLIDGGRGQLASVAKGLEVSGGAGLFPLAAIAKARDEDGHADRRAGNVADRIFVPGRANPLPLRDGSPELLFLQQIRDATHQFAIQSHRKARRSAAFSGELMRLPGVGAATARLLWDKFGSLEAMIRATEEELTQVPGIGIKRARLLRQKLASLPSY